MATPQVEAIPESVTSRPKENLAFIELLRGVAALLVVWDHMIGAYTTSHNIDFAPVNVVRDYITKPLAIIQDFGFLAVVLFFIISGFIISHIAQRESHLEFAIKRLFRIYPPFIISIIITIMANFGYRYLTGIKPAITGFSTFDYIKAMTLVNWVLTPQNPVSGVAWTLVIEVLFYIMSLAFLRLIQKHPVIASGGMAAICLVIILVSRNFGPNFFLFAVSVSYIPFLLSGQALYFLWAKKINFKVYLLLFIIDYIIIIQGIRNINKQFYPENNSYGVSFIYVYLLFIICICLERYLKIPAFLRFYSKISYSIYLYHGAIGLIILDLLYKRIGFVPALIIACAIVTIVSYLSWRFTERPSQKLARNLVKRFKL
jgi:peptidoglycan/LPS O-acetylase OafA/YrhL